MSELLTYLLLGFALGAIPAQTVAGIAVAFLGKLAKVSPKQVEAYRKATAVEDNDDEGGD
jgi:hypothetical protein